MRTPPGVTPAVFAEALARFQAVVGKAWVFTSEEDLDLYRDAYSPLWGEPDERLASAAVAPASVDQVQAVMKIADALKIPIYPFSTGRNLTYGGSAPVLSGSVILELRRMDRILEISEQNASVLVEPGVTYFDLYRHIREKGLKLWIDCPDPGWGSLIGNALEHGAGRTALPYRDHFEAHCGMEVVLPNGELVRTGMGAIPNAPTWQQCRYGAGPSVDGLFAQSNFGVVTKMGFWLMPEPEAALTVSVTAQRHDDIVPLVEILANLIYRGIVPSHTDIVSPLFHGPPGPDVIALRSKPGGASWAELDAFAQSKALPFWNVQFTFYGPPAINQAQWDYVKGRFAAIPGARFREDGSFTFPLSDEEVRRIADKTVLGIPNLALFQTHLAAGAPPLEGHMDFSPIVPMNGAAVLEALKLFGDILLEEGVTPMGGRPEFYHARTMTLIYAIPTGKDPQTNAKARRTFARLIKAGAAKGWGEYRVHPAMMDEAVGVYSFNDHALTRLHETLKDAIDPNGIVSAGRYGVWPKHLRKAKGKGTRA
jgi:4-cresol dehydrogenase (hydroxylating)